MKRFPRIYIEISNRCNLACAFCPSFKRDIKTMDETEFVHILNKISPYTDHIYLHVQGEPLLHPRLMRFLDIAYSHHLKVHLVTNGTLLNNYGTTLPKHPALAQLTISLHAWESMPEEKFKQLNELLKTIIEESESYTCSLFLRIWNKRSERMNRILEANFSEEELMGWFQPSKKRLKLRKNITLDLDQEFLWPSLSNPFVSIEGNCHAGTMMMAVLANGDVTPCCLDPEGILTIGNIHTLPFDTILSNTRYIRFMEGIKEKTCTEELCRHCSFRTRFK